MGNDFSHTSKASNVSPNVENSPPETKKPKPSLVESESSYEGKFSWMEGRSYHNITKSSYFLPNDSQESDRLLQQHFALRWAFEGNLLAPCEDILKRGGKVLDVGCAQGAWILEMATDFPSSQFIGIDISDLAPKEIKPHNAQFFQENILEGLPFADNTFDLVAMRDMVVAFRANEWPIVLKEIMRVTKAGGWIQLVDIPACIFRSDHLSELFVNKFKQMMALRDMDPMIAQKLGQLLKQAGALEVDHGYKSCPLYWGGELGNIIGNSIHGVIATYRSFWQQVFCILPDELDKMLFDLKREWAEKRSYVNYHYYITQKPSNV